MAFKRVKGTEDFYPIEKAVQQRIFDVLRDTAKKYGFLEIESPAIESLGLLTAKSGEETTRQIFTFEKKGEELLGLRFDLTVPFTRMFIEKQKELVKPVKWFGISRMWRYEAPQKGRSREFYQLSVEMFGSDKPEADAEIIELAIECLRRLGLQKDDFEVRISNRNLVSGLLEDVVGAKLDAVLAVVDKKSKLSEEEFRVLLQDVLKDSVIVKSVMSVLVRDDARCALNVLSKLKMNAKARKGFDDLQKVLGFLQEYLDYVVVDLSVVRGLAYYTGTVFEVFDKKTDLRAVAGGGRYDELVGLFGGDPMPATGFGMGDKTLTLLLENRKLLPSAELGPDYYIAPVSESVSKEAREIARVLREKASVEIDLLSRKLAKQLEYANSIGAKKVIIVGEKDLKEGRVTVRDLKSGEQKAVAIKDL